MSGADLSRAYHRDVVAPLLLGRWPGLRYAAGRLGSGSDVLGYDDELSQDHDWGLRLNVLVEPGLVEPVRVFLRENLPETYAGRPVRFPTSWQPEAEIGVQVDAPEEFAHSRLGVSVGSGLDPAEWLALTGQAVLEVTAGPVFVDTEGALTAIREALRWYPDDVWRYVVAADWSRLGQELAIAGRAGDRGDDTGSRVVMARLVDAATHLAFLIERRWAPYPKWRGTAFLELAGSATVGPFLAAALSRPTWQGRQDALAAALEALGSAQRAAGLPTPEPVVVPFFDRPYLTVAEEVVPLLRKGIEGEVAALPWGVGSFEQWVDSVDVLRPPDRRVAAVRAVLRPEA